MQTIIRTHTCWLFAQTLLLLAFFCLGYTACTEDVLEKTSNKSGRAIQIMASMPNDFTHTKAAVPKGQFADKDVIHICAEFTLSGSNTSSATAYASMEYTKGEWKPKGNNITFDWPWNATKAIFTAYFIPPVGELKNNDAISNGANNNTVSMNLSQLSVEAVKNGTDPLIATYTADVEGAVHLQFGHIFTKLTFVNLNEEGDLGADVLTKGQELRLSAAELKDSLVFTRIASGDALSYQTVTSRGYISNTIEENELGKSITFLMPATDNKDIKLKLAFKDFTPYHIVPIQQPMVAGKHYSLDITQLADNGWDNSLKEEEWNKDSNTGSMTSFDRNMYLRAIRDGQEYVVNGVQVLEVYKENIGGLTRSVVTQLTDVDFNDEVFTPVNLSTGVIFNGNFHKVKGVKVTKAINNSNDVANMALFGENAGTIKNLIIEKASVEPEAGASPVNIGILAGHNTANGHIENVRISFTTTTTTSSVKGTASTLRIGALVGYSEGVLKDCVLSGTPFTVEATATTENLYAGGLVGYSSSISVSGCKVQAAATSKVSITSANSKNIYAGGFAGYSTITDAKKSIQSCSSSAGVEVVGGVTVYAGGFSGFVSNTVEKCSATGVVALSGGSTTGLYAGGFAGNISNATLKACYATGGITATGTPTTSYIGGFVGWLIYDGEGKSDLLNCYTIGSVPTTGNAGFVGHASSKGNTETTDKDKIAIRNSFSKNIATAFIGNEAGATLTNYHHSGKVANTYVTAQSLNESKLTGAFTWTDSPALFGSGIPYLIFVSGK